MKNKLKEKFNLTDVQAAVLYEIARHGYITVNVLRIVTADFSESYTHKIVKRLEKLKLVRLKTAKIIAGSKFIIYPKQIVKDFLKGTYTVPRPPKSVIQYRHNLIAIAVILIEKQLKNADGYLTTNQVNKFKNEGKWKSRKTPDGIVVKNQKGYLIEVELHIKSYEKYKEAFKAIEIETVKSLKNGWWKNIYYVDNKRAFNKMNKIINWLKQQNGYVAETAENTEVVYLQDLLNEFNKQFNSNVKLEIFHPVF